MVAGRTTAGFLIDSNFLGHQYSIEMHQKLQELVKCLQNLLWLILFSYVKKLIATRINM